MPVLDIGWATAPADMFLAQSTDPSVDTLKQFKLWRRAGNGADRIGPPSTIAAMLHDGSAVWNLLEIDSNQLRLGGGSAPIALQAGRIPDDEKRGSLVVALYDSVLVRSQLSHDFDRRLGEDPARRMLGLRLTPDVPWKTVAEVIFTAGQAGYGSQCFVGDGTFEAFERRCFQGPSVAPLPFDYVPPPLAEIVVKPGGAWRVFPDGEKPLDLAGVAMQGAPPLVMLWVDDSSIPAIDVIKWLGVLDRAGVESPVLRLGRRTTLSPSISK